MVGAGLPAKNTKTPINTKVNMYIKTSSLKGKEIVDNDRMSTDSVLRYRVFFLEVNGFLLLVKHRKSISFNTYKRLDKILGDGKRREGKDINL